MTWRLLARPGSDASDQRSSIFGITATPLAARTDRLHLACFFDMQTNTLLAAWHAINSVVFRDLGSAVLFMSLELVFRPHVL